LIIIIIYFNNNIDIVFKNDMPQTTTGSMTKYKNQVHKWSGDDQFSIIFG